jgi:hypothetical protein
MNIIMENNKTIGCNGDDGVSNGLTWYQPRAALGLSLCTGEEQTVSGMNIIIENNKMIGCNERGDGVANELTWIAVSSEELPDPPAACCPGFCDCRT